MKRSIKYLIFSLVAIVMLSSAAVAFAQGGQGGPGGPGGSGGPGGRGAGGEVTAINGSTIVVTNPHGDEENIVTTDSTEFVVNDEAGSLDDITVGMFVFAEGERADDGTFTATKVVASDDMPQPPGGPGGPGGPGRGIGGEVTSIDGSTIVVKNPHGDEESIVTTDSTEFVVNDEAGSLDDIAVGMFVCAEGEKDDAGNFTATKVITSDDMPQPPDRSNGGQGGPGGPGGPPPHNNQ